MFLSLHDDGVSVVAIGVEREEGHLAVCAS